VAAGAVEADACCGGAWAAGASADSWRRDTKKTIAMHPTASAVTPAPMASAGPTRERGIADAVNATFALDTLRAETLPVLAGGLTPESNSVGAT
jgi:hypothetical protein